MSIMSAKLWRVLCKDTMSPAGWRLSYNGYSVVHHCVNLEVLIAPPNYPAIDKFILALIWLAQHLIPNRGISALHAELNVMTWLGCKLFLYITLSHGNLGLKVFYPTVGTPALLRSLVKVPYLQSCHHLPSRERLPSSVADLLVSLYPRVASNQQMLICD